MKKVLSPISDTKIIEIDSPASKGVHTEIVFAMGRGRGGGGEIKLSFTHNLGRQNQFMVNAKYSFWIGALKLTVQVFNS